MNCHAQHSLSLIQGIIKWQARGSKSEGATFFGLESTSYRAQLQGGGGKVERCGGWPLKRKALAVDGCTMGILRCFFCIWWVFHSASQTLSKTYLISQYFCSWVCFEGNVIKYCIWPKGQRGSRIQAAQRAQTIRVTIDNQVPCGVSSVHIGNWKLKTRKTGVWGKRAISQIKTHMQKQWSGLINIEIPFHTQMAGGDLGKGW